MVRGGVRSDPVLERLGHGSDTGQWRAQVVGEAGDELTSAFFHLADAALGLECRGGLCDLLLGAHRGEHADHQRDGCRRGQNEQRNRGVEEHLLHPDEQTGTHRQHHPRRRQGGTDGGSASGNRARRGGADQPDRHRRAECKQDGVDHVVGSQR